MSWWITAIVLAFVLGWKVGMMIGERVAAGILMELVRRGELTVKAIDGLYVELWRRKRKRR